MNRRGVTLVEVLIAAVLMGMVGILLSRLLISDSRFVARGNAMTDARQAARAALNTMVNEFRMVGDSGVVAASSTSVKVRIPYAFGVACEMSGSSLIASIMPPDSLMYYQTHIYGIMWRDSVTGYYSTANRDSTLSAVTKTTAPADIALCTQDSIRVVPNGFVVKISKTSGNLPPPNGTIFFLYNTTTYSFAASTMMTGRIGLWRLRSGSGEVNTELVAPFDAGSGFQFDTGSAMLIDSTTPVPTAALGAIRGIHLKLIGASEHTPVGTSSPETFDFRTHVLFLNRMYP